MMEQTSESSQSLVSTPKKRSQADKKGRHKYTLELQHEILDEIKLIRIMQQKIFIALKLAQMAPFDEPFIKQVCAKDEIDKAILQELWEAGHRGILPKDIIANIKHPGLWDRWQVLHRIEHMNKRLQELTGEQVAEKHGHEWALTEFAYEAYDLTKDKIKTGEIQEEEIEKEEMDEDLPHTS